MRSPILFLIFNRPEQTAAAFEAIRAARPPRLYVAADGPRLGRSGEPTLCAQARKVATAVDWPCQVRTLFQDRNLGCRHGVSTGITWFFDNEPEGIIIEDDILPDVTFFPYCDELLERYRNDERIGLVAGSTLTRSAPDGDSYYFSQLARIWGWASWRRVWSRYDVTIRSWKELRGTRSEHDIFRTAAIRSYLRDSIDHTYAGGIDTWDYQFTYLLLTQNQLCVIPRDNLVDNLGYGPGATRTLGESSPLPSIKAMQFPLVHPQFVIPDITGDQAYVTRYDHQGIFKLLRRIAIRILRGVVDPQ